MRITTSVRYETVRPVEVVRSFYSDPTVVKAYMSVGMRPAERKIVEKYLARGSRALEIGCGAGRVAIDLQLRGYDAVGIDFIEEMIEAARDQATRCGAAARFEVRDALKMTFAPASFDHVIFNSLEHIAGRRNRRKLLEDVFRILKPGGYFLLSVRSGLAPGKRWLGWLWMVGEYVVRKIRRGAQDGSYEFGDKVWQEQYHHYLSPFGLRKLLKEIGFSVVEFNSEKNVERGRKASLWTNFSDDIALYFVARKH